MAELQQTFRSTVWETNSKAIERQAQGALKPNTNQQYAANASQTYHVAPSAEIVGTSSMGDEAYQALVYQESLASSLIQLQKKVYKLWPANKTWFVPIMAIMSNVQVI